MNFARMIDCLDHDLCDQLIATDWEYSRSKVIKKAGGTYVHGIRTNTSAQVVGGLERQVHEQLNTALVNWSSRIKSEYPEIAECLYLPGVRHSFDTYRETLGILRYEPGQEYSWHVDQPVESSMKGDHSAHTRLISIVVYLNDDFVGGETEMLGRKYKPKKGKALIFPSNWNYPHRACPVAEGTKYALVTWFHPSH